VLAFPIMLRAISRPYVCTSRVAHPACTLQNHCTYTKFKNG